MFWWIFSMWLLLLYAGFGMLVFVYYFFYISQDSDLYCPSFIIPLQINGTENISLPIFHHRRIVYIQWFNELLYVLLPFIFHSKVIHHKGELNWSCIIPPQPWGARCGAEAIRCHSFLQEFIFQTTCLGKAIHSFIYFNVDVPVLHKCFSLILLHHFFWDNVHCNPNLFWPI